LTVLVLVIGLHVLTACGGEGVTEDLTAREITEKELDSMLLREEVLRKRYAGFGRSNHYFEDNTSSASGSLDEESTARNIERFGRIYGWGDWYSTRDRKEKEEGIALVGYAVELFETATGASGWLEEEVGDLLDLAGKTSELKSGRRFDLDDLGEESLGLLLVVPFPVEPDDFRDYPLAMVSFTRGRIVGKAWVIGSDEKRIQTEVISLALKLDERIQAVLRGEILTPTPEGEGKE